MGEDDDAIISNLNKLFDEFALFEAIEQKNFKRFRALINGEGFNVDYTDASGRSLLMQLATIPNTYKFAKELLQKGASVQFQDKFGYSFLHLAARNKKIDNVKIGELIIDHSADLDCQDNSGLTPLYQACLEGNQKWIYMLLYYGANASVTSYAGLTPLSVLSPSLSRRDDYDLLVDILLLHSFDCGSVSLSTLTATMWKKSSLFSRIVDNTSNVHYDEDGVYNFCEYFGDVLRKHFKLFLEKFESVVDNLINVTDLLNVILEAVTRTNTQEMYQILDYLLYSKHVNKLIQNSTTATSTISQYIEDFASADLEEEIKKRIYLMLSYGLDVTLKDLETVYQHYGFCDLFQTLLHMDVISTDEGNVSCFVRLHYDLSLNVEDCCDDVLSVSHLLDYFNHPKLKEVCLSTSEDVELTQKVIQMSTVPYLVELSRNVARKYVISRFKISTCNQFHTILNGLPIDRLTRSIIALERKIY